MAEQEFRRDRASSFGGSAPRRPRGHRRPIAKLDMGHNQTTWLLVPKGLVTNPSGKSDYTYWLERVVRLLGSHADDQGRKIIELRKKLTALRRTNRELRQQLGEPQEQASANDPLSQEAFDDIERRNLDLRKEVEGLKEALEDCRSNIGLIGVSKSEKHEDIEARIREPYRQAAAENERKIRELQEAHETLKASSAEAGQAHEQNVRLLKIAQNNMQFLINLSDVAPIDSITERPPRDKYEPCDLVVVTSDELRVVYNQRASGKCFVYCASTKEAEEQIKHQSIELDETGQLSTAQLDVLDQLGWAVTHEGKAALKKEISAARFKQIYG